MDEALEHFLVEKFIFLILDVIVRLNDHCYEEFLKHKSNYDKVAIEKEDSKVVLTAADCLISARLVVVKVRIYLAFKVRGWLSQEALDYIGPGICRSQDKKGEGAFRKCLKIQIFF